jgi:hypothetical protein
MRITELRETVDFLALRRAILTKGGIDSVVCAANLLDLKALLEWHEIPFLLAFGTLLGAYRNGAFIRGDHDTDIIVPEEKEGALRMAFSCRRFRDTGFRVCRVVPDLVSIERSGEYIDAYIFRGTGRLLRCAATYKMNRSYLAHPSPIAFLGTTFLTVSDPEKYLEERYGDWRTPQIETTRM